MEFFTFPDGRLINLDAISMITPHASSEEENRSLVFRFGGSPQGDEEFKGDDMKSLLDALDKRGVDTNPTRRYVSLPELSGGAYDADQMVRARKALEPVAPEVRAAFQKLAKKTDSEK